MSDIPPDQLTYGEAVEQLNAIVDDLDSGVVDVDALTLRFQRAIDIIEDLDGRIHRARAKIDELSPRLDVLAGARGDGTASDPTTTSPGSAESPTTLELGEEPRGHP